MVREKIAQISGGSVTGSSEFGESTRPSIQPSNQEETEARAARGSIRPRVEIVWARQELQRLTQQFEDAQLALLTLQADLDSALGSGDSGTELDLRAEVKRLRTLRRNLVRWLIGVGEDVSEADRELAAPQSSPSGGKSSSKRKSKKKGQAEKAANGGESKKRKTKGTSAKSRGKGESGAWPTPTHGGRRRARFIS